MLIVIEGPDNGGKSTLVERLVRTRPRGGFVSMLGGRTDPPEESRKRAYAAMYSGDPALLTERFHPISDLVYRQIDGGHRVFSATEYESFARYLAVTKSKVVYCRPPVEEALRVVHRPKGDDTEEWSRLVVHTMEKIFHIYDDVMFELAWRHGVSVFRYDWTDVKGCRRLEEAICAALA